MKYRMCISQPRTVVRVEKDTVVLDDGRTIRTGLVTDVHPGDRLEVYGDIALSKIHKEEHDEK